MTIELHVDGARTVATAAQAAVHAERMPGLDGARVVEVAERFRDLPGLAVLESARPGRRSAWSYLSADPLGLVLRPSDEPGHPFGGARAALARLDPGVPADPGAPPFAGGLIGYIGYDVGRRLERWPEHPVDDQNLPSLRLALHDWVLAWNRRTGAAWLAGRTVDGNVARLAERLAFVRDRIGAEMPTERAGRTVGALEFSSNMSRETYEAGVKAIREAIARGEIYQANLARRLETGYTGDPWAIYRMVRDGDPALLAAFLDLGTDTARGGGRALISASPEPFLAVDRDGLVTADPIKGTRSRGRSRSEERELARELLASEKDRAENTMIVDVLRNDLGRVSVPGSVRVPRLWRLERTATIQHLVSTVTSRLRRGADAFDLMAASFPGGSITGAPKLRAIEILAGLEPVRRGPYTGAAGWFGPDGAATTSILIRTFVADGRRLTLHVGGGITWRSDPSAEWAETVAKSRGPLGAIGATEIDDEARLGAASGAGPGALEEAPVR